MSNSRFQQKLGAILDAVAHGVTAQDANGKLIYANDEGARAVGFPSGAALVEAGSDNVLAAIDLLDESGNPISVGLAPTRMALTGIEPEPMILQFRYKETGARRWILLRAKPLFDEAGKLEFVVTTLLDVTERKRAQLQQQYLIEVSDLLSSSLDYETTLKNIARLAVPTIADYCAVELTDEQGTLRPLTLTHIDPERERLMISYRDRYASVTAAPNPAMPVFQSGKSRLIPEITEQMIAQLPNEEDRAFVLSTKPRSVMYVPMRVRGSSLGILTFSTDDTSGRTLGNEDVALAEELARRAALAIDNAMHYREARSQRERLRVTLASIGDAVVVTDNEGRVTFLNGVAEVLTGWSLDEAIGQPISAIFPIVNENTRETVENPAARVLREGVIVGLANHTVLLARDGREIPLDDSGAPIFDTNGRLIGVVLVFRDITQRKQLEQERERALAQERRAREAAERADQMKLQFLAMISHELRTPLTAIKGFTSTLLATDVEWPPETQQQFITIMDDEASKLAELVEQLIDVSRMQAGTLRIHPVAQPLPTIISVALAQLLAITTKHELRLDIPGDLPPVLADGQRIAQVLVNLVDNAVKYSPTDTPITVSAYLTDGGVQINVRDHGRGIAPGERDAVFEAFRQIYREGEGARPRGAGLGLAICKGLIEQHGGHIWIGDTPPPGTLISFTLPVAETQPGSA